MTINRLEAYTLFHGTTYAIKICTIIVGTTLLIYSSTLEANILWRFQVFFFFATRSINYLYLHSDFTLRRFGSFLKTLITEHITEDCVITEQKPKTNDVIKNYAFVNYIFFFLLWKFRWDLKAYTLKYTSSLYYLPFSLTQTVAWLFHSHLFLVFSLSLSWMIKTPCWCSNIGLR